MDHLHGYRLVSLVDDGNTGMSLKIEVTRRLVCLSLMTFHRNSFDSRDALKKKKNPTGDIKYVHSLLFNYTASRRRKYVATDIVSCEVLW